MNRRLVLASGSPRRRQLLPLLGLPFVVKAVSVDEGQLPGEPPTEMVLRVSQAKALAAARRTLYPAPSLYPALQPDELVVAADTVVVLDGEVLGKPTEAEDAARMLHRLRGRPHLVYSGVSVWHPSQRRMVCELAESKVWMRDYSDDEAARYVESGDPLDKAGAYAIQHPEFDPVSRVEGCRLSVVGLPLCHLSKALAQFGVKVPSDVASACRAFDQQDCQVSSSILHGTLYPARR